MDFHGLDLTALLGFPLIFVDFHGFPRFPWVSPGFNGFPWISLGFHGLSWNSTDFHGFPWVFMGIPGFSWVFREFHGFPRVQFSAFLRYSGSAPLPLELGDKSREWLFPTPWGWEWRIPVPSSQIPNPKSRDNGFSRQFTAPSPAEAQDWVEQIQFLLKGESGAAPAFWDFGKRHPTWIRAFHPPVPGFVGTCSSWRQRKFQKFSGIPRQLSSLHPSRPTWNLGSFPGIFHLSLGFSLGFFPVLWCRVWSSIPPLWNWENSLFSSHFPPLPAGLVWSCSSWRQRKFQKPSGTLWNFPESLDPPQAVSLQDLSLNLVLFPGIFHLSLFFFHLSLGISLVFCPFSATVFGSPSQPLEWEEFPFFHPFSPLSRQT